MSKISDEALYSALAKEGERKSKTLSKPAIERVTKAETEALNEERRETRFSSPKLEDESKGIYEYVDASGGYGKPMMIRKKKGGMVSKCPYDGIAERGKTRAKLK